MTDVRDDDRLEFEGLHQFQVGTLATPVQVRIYRRGDGAFILEQSHFLRTAIQYLPHAYKGPFQGTLAEALAQLKGAISDFFEQAVRRGYPPSEGWLVPNTLFPT